MSTVANNVPSTPTSDRLHYSFGSNDPEQIYNYICQSVKEAKYVTLNRNKTLPSISMFDSVVFRIRINNKTQCLDTENPLALEYISDIAGASVSGEVAHIPLMTTESSVKVIVNMIQEIYDYCRSQVTVEKFGCCNDHVRCSDAGYCLHASNRDYWGCYYRKNLESGKIFYGKNKNYPHSSKEACDPPKQRYIVFDVETPNSQNNRISSIGIVVVENGKMVQEFYSLVNPEAHFDKLNIEITSITPESVVNQPTFPEIWENIKDIMASGLLVAHNAPFDISVLAKCLKEYHIEWLRQVSYSCTCKIGRACISGITNCQLRTLCDHFGIQLENHHNALSDAKACASLLIHYIQNSISPEDYIASCNLLEPQTNTYSHAPKISSDTKQLLLLKELLADISKDGILTLTEIASLQSWMHENHALRDHFPFDKVFEVVNSSMEDGVLDTSELQVMLETFEKITDPLALNNSCNCTEFDISGKLFCLSGDFEFGSRSEVEKHFIQQGGIPSKSVTKKTDYLIVGKKGSTQWSTGNYGTKVQKAIELQEKGLHIQIIKEENLF